LVINHIKKNRLKRKIEPRIPVALQLLEFGDRIIKIQSKKGPKHVILVKNSCNEKNKKEKPEK
jgi:hypothetical protein